MSLNVPSSNRVKNYLPRVHLEGKVSECTCKSPNCSTDCSNMASLSD